MSETSFFVRGACLALLSACISFPLARHADAATLETLLPHYRVSSTVPKNGDLNPYGVAFVPVGFPAGGIISPGDVLVSNFNDINNCQGQGTHYHQVHAKQRVGAGQCGAGCGTGSAWQRHRFLSESQASRLVDRARCAQGRVRDRRQCAVRTGSKRDVQPRPVLWRASSHRPPWNVDRHVDGHGREHLR
jgi:hypothetical protein